MLELRLELRELRTPLERLVDGEDVLERVVRGLYTLLVFEERLVVFVERRVVLVERLVVFGETRLVLVALRLTPLFELARDTPLRLCLCALLRE